MRFRLITAWGGRLMSDFDPGGLPPYIVSYFRQLIRYVDHSWLWLSKRPHFTLEYRGWKLLLLPPLESGLRRDITTAPSTETDDHQI